MSIFGAGRLLPTPRTLLGVLLATSMTAAGGCSSRFGDDQDARTPVAPVAAKQPRQPDPDPGQGPPSYDNRQGVGANKVWMDDPAKRKGPQGQPAPYGRDTLTGRPLTDLQTPPADNVKPTRPATAAVPARPKPAAAGGSTIVVAKGDTLSGLARRHKVTVDALMRANNLTNDAKIRAGQTLVLPGH